MCAMPSICWPNSPRIIKRLLKARREYCFPVRQHQRLVPLAPINFVLFILWPLHGLSGPSSCLYARGFQTHLGTYLFNYSTGFPKWVTFLCLFCIKGLYKLCNFPPNLWVLRRRMVLFALRFCLYTLYPEEWISIRKSISRPTVLRTIALINPYSFTGLVVSESWVCPQFLR